jgi:hypothetical protein
LTDPATLGSRARRIRAMASLVPNRLYADFLMPSRIGDYSAMLARAQAASYRVTSIERFWAEAAQHDGQPRQRTLILRHDVDTDPSTAAAMWNAERALGITETSYFFRLSTVDVALMQAIEGAGGNVGYHYEELATLAKARRLRGRDDVLERLGEAQQSFRRNLQDLRERTGLRLAVAASHGDFVNRRLGLPNWILLEPEDVRRECGIELEAYDDAFMRGVTSRHSDTGHPRYWITGNPIDAIDRREPVVYLLVHPRHWRRAPIINARDDARRLADGLRYGLPGRGLLGGR